MKAASISTTFKAGDKVSFTLVRPQGNVGIHVSSREGTLVSPGPVNSTVKFKNGRTTQVASNSLRPVGVQNALTEGFLKLAEELANS